MVDDSSASGDSDTDLKALVKDGDDKNSKVNIYVNDLDDKKIAKITKSFDSPAIEFTDIEQCRGFFLTIVTTYE